MADPMHQQKIQKMFESAKSAHEQISAPYRAELAERSPGEKLYDDCLLAAMRAGKPFKAALQEANARYPDEALHPPPEDMGDVEEHYKFIFNMLDMDEKFAALKARAQQQAASEQSIDSLVDDIMRQGEGKRGSH